MITIRRCVNVLLAPCVLVVCATAQMTTGSITGTVRDPAGAVVPGARVEAANLATGLRLEGRCNDAGIYLINFVNPGRYQFAVEAPGFRRYIRTPVVVETGITVSLDVVLEIGESAESITVTAEPPLLQADRSSLNQVVENRTVADMPLASRRVGQLMRLLANVNMQGENMTAGWVDFTLGGGRGRQQNWQIDGAAMQAVPMFTAAVDANPPVEAIEEIKVEVNAYSAEYGRSTGGFIAMTTKSGTNQVRGALYHYLRNDAMDARRFFAPAVAPRKYNVFGGSVGGPVIRDRTHYFFSYEGTRYTDGATRTMSVPTPQEIQGDFSASAGSPIDPLSRTPFPNKRIPAARLDPIGSRLATLYPAPNVSGAVSGGNNYRLNTANRLTANSFIGRLDHSISSTDRLTARILQYRGRTTRGSVTPVPSADPSGGIDVTNTLNLTPGWFHNFSATTFNEVRVGILSRWQEQPRPDDSGIAGQLGLRGVDPAGMPRVTVTGLSSLGLSNQGRLIRPVRSFHVSEALTWFRGKHTVKFGGEWRRSSITDAQFGSKSGAFGFNDVATSRGFGLAALLLGWANTATVRTGDASPFMHYGAWYIQDDWKATPKLTLNFGLRWDLDTPWREAKNRRSGFNPIPINPVSGTPGIMTFAGIDGEGPYAHAFDYNNYGPRFGFAWRPFGVNTVFRGGYGLIYGGIYDGSFGRVFSIGYGDDRTLASPNNGLTPAILLRDGMPVIPQAPLGPGFGAVKVGEPIIVGPEMALPDQRNPYAHHANFNIQRQLPQGFMVELGYLTNLGHKVAGRNVSINEIRPELRGNVADQRLRPFPQYGNVTMRSPNWGNSSYHALSTKAQKRFSRGMNLLATYTWSKFIDDVEAVTEGAGAPGDGQQSYYARHLDKALSGSDQRHRLTTSLVYELPVGKGKPLGFRSGALDRILGGWNLGTILELRSGLPYGVIESSNRMNAFSSGSQRSNIVGEVKLPSGRSRAEFTRAWFNTAAFAFPGNGMIGNAGRAVGVGPGYANIDASLFKQVQLGENRLLQLRGEFFNLLNRPNFDNPNTSRGAAAFGQISDTVNDGRFIQVGLRLVF